MTRLDGAKVEVEDLLLLGELLLHALLDHIKVDAEELRHHAHVDHVPDQLAQLGLGADRRGDLVEGNRIAHHIAAVLLQVQVLFVDCHAAGGKSENVVFGGFRVQCHQDLGIARAGYVTIFAGANRVPGGKSGDVRREKVFTADGYAHSEDAFQQNAIGGLRAGPVHRCYDYAEVVDYALSRANCALFLTEGKVSCRHLAGIPSDEFLNGVTALRKAAVSFPIVQIHRFALPNASLRLEVRDAVLPKMPVCSPLVIIVTFHHRHPLKHFKTLPL